MCIRDSIVCQAWQCASETSVLGQGSEQGLLASQLNWRLSKRPCLMTIVKKWPKMTCWHWLLGMNMPGICPHRTHTHMFIMQHVRTHVYIHVCTCTPDTYAWTHTYIHHIHMYIHTKCTLYKTKWGSFSPSPISLLHTHTHTHTHLFIYLFIYLFVYSLFILTWPSPVKSIWQLSYCWTVL